MEPEFAITKETRREGMEKLIQLADFLTQLPNDRFDFARWVGADWRGDPSLSCGTTACAGGWATTLWPDSLVLRKYRWQKAVALKNHPEIQATEALQCFFALTDREATLLFVPFEEFVEQFDHTGEKSYSEQIEVLAKIVGFDLIECDRYAHPLSVAFNMREFANSALRALEEDRLVLM